MIQFTSIAMTSLNVSVSQQNFSHSMKFNHPHVARKTSDANTLIEYGKRKINHCLFILHYIDKQMNDKGKLYQHICNIPHT